MSVPIATYLTRSIYGRIYIESPLPPLTYHTQTFDSKLVVQRVVSTIVHVFTDNIHVKFYQPTFILPVRTSTPTLLYDIEIEEVRP